MPNARNREINTRQRKGDKKTCLLSSIKKGNVSKNEFARRALAPRAEKKCSRLTFSSVLREKEGGGGAREGKERRRRENVESFSSSFQTQFAITPPSPPLKFRENRGLEI